MVCIPFFPFGFPLSRVFRAPVIADPISSLRTLAFSTRPLNLSDFDVGLPHILGWLSVARILLAVTHRRCNFPPVAGQQEKDSARIKQGVSTISRFPESSYIINILLALAAHLRRAIILVALPWRSSRCISSGYRSR